MEIRNLTCIGCPLGCNIAVTFENGKVCSLTGNSCKRGDAYAREEVSSPKRIVTSTVRVKGGTRPVVSVKTIPAITKDQIFACMEQIRNMTIAAPVDIGDILVYNIAGTDSNLVATAHIKKADN